MRKAVRRQHSQLLDHFSEAEGAYLSMSRNPAACASLFAVDRHPWWIDEAESQGPSISHVSRLVVLSVWFPIDYFPSSHTTRKGLILYC